MATIPHLFRLGFLCGICWLAACSPKHIPQPSPTEPQALPDHIRTEPQQSESSEPRLIAGLSKSPCYGQCPAYEVWIYTDGTVLWCGEAHVSRIGHFKATAPPSWIEDWFKTAEEAGYWGFQGHYPVNGAIVKDLPITVSYLRQGKKERRIVDNADAPPALQRLEKYWQQKLDELSWLPHQP